MSLCCLLQKRFCGASKSVAYEAAHCSGASACQLHFCNGVRSCHSALRLVGQEPEPSQETDMALACCFLGKGLRCRLPLLSLAFRHSNLRRLVPPRGEGCNYGREYCPII